MKYIQEISRRRLPATIRAEYDRERHDARLPVLRTITLLLALFYFSYRGRNKSSYKSYALMSDLGFPAAFKLPRFHEDGQLM